MLSRPLLLFAAGALALSLALLSGCGAEAGGEGAAPAPPSARDLAAAQQLQVDAIYLAENGENTEAMRLLSEALSLAPDLEAAHRARVRFGPSSAYFDEVIASGDWLAARDPDDVDMWLTVAKAGLNGGRLDDSKRALRRAQALAPDSAQIESLWARVHFELGELEQAEKRATRSAALVPEQTSAHYIVGLCAEDREDLDAAIEAYRKVIYVDPGHLGARDHLATSLLRDGRRKEANRHRAIHTMIIKAMPGAFRQFPPAEREATFREVTEKLPEWDVGHIELARALLQLSRFDEAEAAAEAALGARASAESAELLATIRERGGAAR